ncbi:MAG: hypothetical protein ABIN83_05770 [Sphingomicrobium sp.]
MEAEGEPLRAAGLAEDFRAVRAHVDADLPPGNEASVTSGAYLAVLRQARVSSTTNSLVRFGYRAKHFADRGQASRLVRAAAALEGSGTAADAAVSAPTVALADLIRVEDMPDGSVYPVYRVVEPLKQAPPAGTEIRLLLHGARPPLAPYPNEEDTRTNKHVILLLKPPGSVIGAQGDPAAVLYSRIGQPMVVEGETVIHNDLPEVTLTKLRATIREQICSPGYVPVGTPRLLSLRC